MIKKLILALMLTIPTIILAQEADNNSTIEKTGKVETGVQEVSLDEVEGSFDTFTNTGKKGELRLSSSIAWNTFKGSSKSQFSYRGNYDYFLSNYFSISGTSHIPLMDVDTIRPYFFGLGMNFHFFQWGDLDFFAGGTSGFTVLTHGTLPTKALSTVDLGGGIAFYGEFLHIISEVVYRHVDYYARNTYIDLSTVVYSLGIGMKF